MIRRLLLPMVSLAASMAFTAGSGAIAKFEGPPPLPQPVAPMPNRDNLIEPPGETHYVLLRRDGQPFYLNIDETVNLTDYLNRYYFNPHWRGEEWGPFCQYWICERASRMMNTWEEYDQENVLHIGNKYAKWFEKYSGFGPP